MRTNVYHPYETSANMKLVKKYFKRAKHDRIKTAGNLHAYTDTTRARLHKQYKKFVEKVSE